MPIGGGEPGTEDDEETVLQRFPPAFGSSSLPARIAHFRILGRLGQGGMGVVYRAEDEVLRRIVALKLLSGAGPERDEARARRFLREARSAASITHPNVAVVHQIGEQDGRVYIAMELVEGEDLRARLERGRLDAATVRELAGQIARGLSAAHEKGIVHRDLKPENVMITPSGLVKLLDFGLAKVEAGEASALATTETEGTLDDGRAAGTPEYMSPEQALGEVVGTRSDVFSFGTLLYEMLTGTRPFAGASTGAVLVSIVRDAPTPLRARAPAVDELMETIVERCHAKAPGERFASAAELVTALSGRTSPPPTAQSVRVDSGASERATRRSSAPVARALGGAALLVGIAAVLVTAGFRARPSGNASQLLAPSDLTAGAAGLPAVRAPQPVSVPVVPASLAVDARLSAAGVPTLEAGTSAPPAPRSVRPPFTAAAAPGNGRTAHAPAAPATSASARPAMSASSASLPATPTRSAAEPALDRADPWAP